MTNVWRPEEQSGPGRTGWPPGLLQDDCRGLAKWFASRPDARRRVREALELIEAERNGRPA